MSNVRPEFLSLDRDELLCVCELLAIHGFMRGDELAETILHARWTIAQNRVIEADRASHDAWSAWSALVAQSGKLTSARLADRERAERKRDRLDAAARRASAYERELWAQVSSGWSRDDEVAP